MGPCLHEHNRAHRLVHDAAVSLPTSRTIRFASERRSFATSREVRYDPELGQLVFSPLAEQAQLRGDVLTRMGATTVAPGAELQLSKGWPAAALRQAEVTIQLELPSSTARIALTLRDPGDSCHRR